MHRKGNYLLGLVSATGLLAPLSLPGPAGTQYPLSLARAAYRARASKTDKVKALLWSVMNWFVLHAGRACVRVCVCVWGGERMTLRGHGGDEEVTNKGQEEWGSVSQIKISKGGGAGELQEPQLGLCFMGGWGWGGGCACQRHHQGRRPQSASKWWALTSTSRPLISRSHLCSRPPLQVSCTYHHLLEDHRPAQK